MDYNPIHVVDPFALPEDEEHGDHHRAGRDDEKTRVEASPIAEVHGPSYMDKAIQERALQRSEHYDDDCGEFGDRSESSATLAGSSLNWDPVTEHMACKIA